MEDKFKWSPEAHNFFINLAKQRGLKDSRGSNLVNPMQAKYPNISKKQIEDKLRYDKTQQDLIQGDGAIAPGNSQCLL